MQAYTYCRVSTDEQATDNHYSLENQEKKARDYIKLKEWRVADIRKDVASGKDSNRDGYKDLLKAIKSGRVNVVVVYRLDRLSRNVKDIYDFLDLIRQHNVAFVSVSEGFDTTTAMGRAMLGVAAVFAQLTREMIAENVKDGMMRRAQAGLYTGTSRGPMGYIYDSGSKSLEVVPEEADVVKKIFDLYTERKWGTEKIASFLNDLGIATKNNSSWRLSTVRRILTNPVYIGKVNWHDSVFDGNHKPILSDEIFSAAQELMAARKPLPGRMHQSQHLLSGIACCGDCGKRLIGHYGSAKKNGERHIFYFHRREGLKDECKSYYRSAKKLEAVVLDRIRAAAADDTLSKLAYEELHKDAQSKKAPLSDRRDVLISELASLKDSFNSWADRLDKGTIDEDQFTQQNGRLLERKRQLSQELEAIDTELARCEDAGLSIEAARDALRQFPKIWDSLEIEEQKELVRLLVEKLGVYKDRVKIKLTFLPEETIEF